MSYVIVYRTGYTIQPHMKCPCCGGGMRVEKETEKIMTLKCEECGLSDSKLKP
ncbi:MAG: hypothetical protein H0X50_04460 [Nitrosopumilus sp.]|nr:hypothetical protein [Nitrosopumilus sp.]